VVWLAAIAACLIVVGALVVYFAPQAFAPAHPIDRTPVALTQTQCAEKLPVDILAGQVLMVGLPGDQLSKQAAIFRKYHVGGAVIMSSPADPHDGTILAFKQNGGNPGNPLLIATDEEGGIVQRFQDLGTLLAPADVANTYTTAQAEAMVAQHGTKLKAVGIDMVLGPLADVAPAQGTSALGNRVFSSNPDAVGSYAAAYMQGWQAAGLLPTLKHFPGMGSATGNTDFQPATTPPLASLKQRDFLPYVQLASSGTAVMIGNQNVPGWFPGPASLSPVVNAYLRNTLGYQDNLVVTDSLDTAAVASVDSVPTAVVKAIVAGNDMAIIVAPNADSITQNLNLGFIRQSELALERAVQSGALSKHQLAVSVARKLTAQHILACSLAP
jgi:beta-N-acetylhexosaminidase